MVQHSSSFNNKMLFWASFFTLIAAGMGTASPVADWRALAGVTGGALGAAFVVFVASARSRA